MLRKYLMSLLMALLSLTASQAQTKKNITFSGIVKFPDTSKKLGIYLGKYEGEGFKREFKILDSARLDNSNQFKFQVPASREFYEVRVYYMDRVTFWSEKDDIHVAVRGIDTAKMKIKNPPYIYMENTSPENDVINDVNLLNYLEYQRMIAVGQEQYQARIARDTVWANYLQTGFDRLQPNREFQVKYLVHKYRNYPTVIYALNLLSWKRDRELIMSTLDNLIQRYPWMQEAKRRKQEILENIAQTSKIANGQTAPDFAYPDITGKKWGPKNYKGEYLIIDFWASWCGPCRQEIPHLKDVYAKYKQQGLEILSVSVDAKEKAWKDALLDEKMPWRQVLAQDSKPLMAAYLFQGIPYLVVIDKEGRIIEKNVRGESLDKVLVKLFGK